MQRIQKRDLTSISIGVIFLVCSGILQQLARKTNWFGTWYMTHIYPLLSGSIGRFFGLFPFSAVEFGLYLLVAGSLVYVVLHIRKPFRVFSRIFLLSSILLCVYTCNCGINYYAKSFSSIADIAIQKYSTDELYELCAYLIEQARLYETTDSYEDHKEEWKTVSVEAMNALGEQYQSLDGYYPMPKEVTISRILSVQQLCGVYSPFTIEANFNGEMPNYNVPHTICHELSHLRGFMREDEANFIGYLACIGSENEAFRYSGYLTGWVYAGQALAKVDLERYYQLSGTISAQMRKDLEENNAFWRQYDGAIAEASSQMNDTYLKINDQQDGIQSYGRVVDLMLAYYRG